MLADYYTIGLLCYPLVIYPRISDRGLRGSRTAAQTKATLGDPSAPSSLEGDRPRRLERAKSTPGGENRARGGPSRPNLVEKVDFGAILERFFMDFGTEIGSETASSKSCSRIVFRRRFRRFFR